MPRATLASVGLAAAATLLAASSAVPLVEAIQALVPAVVLVLAGAGLLHVAVGYLAPRPGWAMATPAPVLFAWLTWALWRDLTAQPGDLEAPPNAGPGLVGFLLAVALGFGALFAGCIRLGAWARRDSEARRARATAAPGPPYP